MQEKIAYMQKVSVILLAQICNKPQYELFDSLGDYKVYFKNKKSGGLRKISEPFKDLKDIQENLLSWLYRIQKRSEFYNVVSVKERLSRSKLLFDKSVLEYKIDDRIHGSLKKHSLIDTLKIFQKNNNHYVIELDLKDAFPSVSRILIEDLLYKIVFDEFKSYFYTYKNRKIFLSAFNPGFHRRYHMVFKKFYLKYPLFSSREFRYFRKFVRDQANLFDVFEDSILPNIAKYFANYFSLLVSNEECLPQGAPTSPFILNLILSNYVLKDLDFIGGVYVDNIYISSNKKPSKDYVLSIISQIESSLIFKINHEKTKIYDLRNRSASALGLKITKRIISNEEFESLTRYDYQKGMFKRFKSDGNWTVTNITLPKKKQKQYRAFIYKCLIGNPNEIDLSKAHGYLGHIISVYGWPTSLMPSSLRKVIDLYRKKYIRPI